MDLRLRQRIIRSDVKGVIIARVPCETRDAPSSIDVSRRHVSGPSRRHPAANTDCERPDSVYKTSPEPISSSSSRPPLPQPSISCSSLQFLCLSLSGFLLTGGFQLLPRCWRNNNNFIRYANRFHTIRCSSPFILPSVFMRGFRALRPLRRVRILPITSPGPFFGGRPHVGTASAVGASAYHNHRSPP